MRAHIRLGRVFGIEIGLHYSWFLIALLIVFSLGGYFRVANPGWSTAAVWALAGLTGVLFFVSLLLHELAHCLVAKAHGMTVRAITLFALGGVSQIESEAHEASTEFWMAIAGPITSAAIGGIALGAAALAGWSPRAGEPTPLIAMGVWLGYINLALAIFNLIPGYPLDGGRVLRAIVWWRSGNALLATRTAARVGQVVGGLLALWGLFRFLTGYVGGLWLALIGWFLVQMASESYTQAAVMSVLTGVRVGDIMTRDCPTVDGYSNIQTFALDTLLHTERRCFIVAVNGKPTALVGPAEIASVERSKWPFTTLIDIARPLDETRSVDPDMPVTTALELMARDHVSVLPVVSGGHLDGVLSERQVARFLRARAA
jgi:Zn-dependent protease